MKKTVARVVADYSAIFLVLTALVILAILGGFVIFALGQYIKSELSEYMNFVSGRQLLGGAVAIIAITHGVRT